MRSTSWLKDKARMEADTYIVLIVSFAIPQDATFTEVLRIDFDDTGAFSTRARKVSVLDPAPLEDKYPLLPECRDKCKVDKDKSLFYSQVGKFQDKPTDFAKKESLTLVRGTSFHINARSNIL